jgi:competence protein ComEA
MNRGSTNSMGIWTLTPRELALWLAIVAAVCAGALAGHGRSNSANAQIRIAGSVAESSRSIDGLSWRLELNSASAAELEMLPGIGPRRAQLIVQERRRRGAFANLWELREVPGLTHSLIQRLEPLLKVNPAPSTP